MALERAIQIAKREWGNIKVSLERFGDIGEFDSKNELNTFVSGGPLLIRNLVGMDNNLPTYGYLTKEASYVFTSLASRAAENLGLVGRLAQTFGSGYSWVRTGWFDPIGIEEQKHIIKQLFFLKIFFPLGGHFNWDFNSLVVKTKLEVLLNLFVTWQDNPKSYLQDVNEYKTQLEPLWRGLSSALGLSREFP